MSAPARAAAAPPAVSPLREKVQAEIREAETALATAQEKLREAQAAHEAAARALMIFDRKFSPLQERLAAQDIKLSPFLLAHRAELDRAAQAAKKTFSAASTAQLGALQRRRDAEAASLHLRAVGE